MVSSCCYAAGPWKGRVIDSETKQPIEGAAVVAVWDKEWAGLGAGSSSNFLDAVETTTDNNGDFEISEQSFVSVPYFRKVKGPYFTIFKPGYGSFPRYQVTPTYTPDTLFEGSSAVVELPRMITNEERINSVDGAHTNAPWQKTPILLKLINSERIELGFEPTGPKERK